MNPLVVAPGSPRPGTKLSSMSGTNTVTVSGPSRINHIDLTYSASATVGTRTVRLAVIDADGVVRHRRTIGTVIANGTLSRKIPFAYPVPAVAGETLALAAPVGGGTVNATGAATNVKNVALDTYHALYTEAAPSAYPPTRGTRAYGVSAVVVKDATEVTTYVEGTDYDVDYALGRIRPKTGGGISATDNIVVDFAYASTVKDEINGVESTEPLVLPSGWSLVIEDNASIHSGDAISGSVYGGVL